MGNKNSDRGPEAPEAADEDDAPRQSNAQQQRGYWWIVIAVSFLIGWVQWNHYTFAYHS